MLAILIHTSTLFLAFFGTLISHSFTQADKQFDNNKKETNLYNHGWRGKTDIELSNLRWVSHLMPTPSVRHMDDLARPPPPAPPVMVVSVSSPSPSLVEDLRSQ